MGKQTIGFIGTGVMGFSMAGHLLTAGYPLNVLNRTREKAEPLVERGAAWFDAPGLLAEASDIVITIVGYPNDVEAAYLSDGGIIDSIRPGATAIEMTTSSPALAVRIAQRGAAKGVAVLDAPVSGGDRGGREATLSIMCGGDAEAFDRVLPILEVMGKNIQLQGPAGAGQYTKMCNQIAIAAGMLGVCEAMVYARAAGLNPSHVLDSIETGAAGSWSLSNLAPRALAGDFAPGFKVKHLVKDLEIAVESAQEMGLNLPGLDKAIELYRILESDGEGESGTQALLKLYEQGRVV